MTPLRRRHLLALALPPIGDRTLVADYTFGRTRPDATIRTMAQLAVAFRFRYIYDDAKLDTLPSYWSLHRDYPEGDPRSLHVFTEDRLVLKGRVPPGGGLHTGGLESGMLRALLPFTPGMMVELRARLPRGLGVWPAFWLNPGVETADGHFSALPWPPEIDIFEFYVWQGRTEPRILETAVHPGPDTEGFGPPHDIGAVQGGRFEPGYSFADDFHVFALDWVRDKPIWLLDGKPIRQMAFQWNAPPAHILITNQIGMNLRGVDLTGMQAIPSNWDFTLDYLRVWRRA